MTGISPAIAVLVIVLVLIIAALCGLIALLLNILLKRELLYNEERKAWNERSDGLFVTIIKVIEDNSGTLAGLKTLYEHDIIYHPKQ